MNLEERIARLIDPEAWEPSGLEPTMSDTTPRDQLAELVTKSPVNDEGDTLDDSYWDVMPKAEMIADAIIAAGWRPPVRVVTTVEELDALPEGSVIMEDGGRAYLKTGLGVWEPDGPTWTLDLPATVLWELKEGE